MNCPLCQTPNAPGAYYCSNCRQPLMQYPQQQPVNPYAYQQHQPYQQPAPVSDRGVTVLTIFIAWGLFISLCWLVIQQVIVPNLYKDDDYGKWESVGDIYDLASWIFNIGSVILATVLTIITKNKTARIILIIAGAVDLLVFLIYQFADTN